MRVERFEHRFVEHFPEPLASGVLYVSVPFASVAHACACGCGREVITPLSPVGWSITFDGKSISISPSIGNWSFPCRSHYLVERGEVVWSYDMSEREVQAGRARAHASRSAYYNGHQLSAPLGSVFPTSTPEIRPHSGWSRVRDWFRRK